MIIKRIAPLDHETWPDLTELFGGSGDCASCWCMWWRTPKSDYRPSGANRHGLLATLDRTVSVGLLAYAGEPDTDEATVAGWCAVGPRTSYPRWEDSAAGKARPDSTGRWAVSCFFVRRDHRRNGFTDDLLAAAVEHSRAHGATAVEGYPLTTKAGPAALFVGTANLFARHGFVVVGQPTTRRAVMERTFA
jgi:GNAT superfamily N-acetyltransferase